MKPPPTNKPVCISGRVVGENNKGIAAVLITTTPPTSPQMTDQSGNFDICNIRKVVNKSTGETRPAPLNIGNYTLKATKEGFGVLSMKANFKGKYLRLPQGVLKEKEFNGPDVKKTKPRETKLDNSKKGPVTGS